MEAYGYPVLTADTLWQYLDREGIKPWQKIAPATTLDKYLATELSEEQKNELRFAPRVEVMTLQDNRGLPFRGFRTALRDWATVFVMLPYELVLVIAEYKHGVDELTLVCPSGVPNAEDRKTSDEFYFCAMRETREETGLDNFYLYPLTEEPILIAGRQLTTRFKPFCARFTAPIVRRSLVLDDTEQLRAVLLPLSEWLKLIERGTGIESAGVTTTLLALRYLGL